MSFLSMSDLLKICVEEIVGSADPDWQRIVHYSELKRSIYDTDDIEHEFISSYWNATGEAFELNPSFEASDALRRLFSSSENDENGVISAVRIEIFSDGKFRTKYYYDEHPLMESDYEKAGNRFDFEAD